MLNMTHVCLSHAQVLTNAATSPPDMANGEAMSYDMYSNNRVHILQQIVRCAFKHSEVDIGPLFNHRTIE